jgi:hypothetical protein
MAKKSSNLSSIFKRTEPKSAAKIPARESAAAPAVPGRTVSIGVGLKESEVAELDRLAGQLGIARNELMGFALRRFMGEVRAGTLDLAAQMETTTRRKLRNP